MKKNKKNFIQEELTTSPDSRSGIFNRNISNNSASSRAEQLTEWFYVLVLFVVLPFIYNSKLSDPELTLRYSVFAVFLVFISAILFFRKQQNVFFRKKFSLHLPEIFFLIFLLLNFISSFRSYDAAAGNYDWLRIADMFLFFITTLILFSEENKLLEKIIVGASVSVFIFSVFGWAEIFPAIVNAIGKDKAFQIQYWFGSTLGNKNSYSEVLFMLLPLLAIGIVSFSSWKKYLSLTAFIISLLTIFILQSVSVFIAVSVSSLIVFVLMFSQLRKFIAERISKRSLRISVAIFILLISIGSWLFVHSNNFQSLKVKFTSFSSFISESENHEHSKQSYGSFTERYLLWQHTSRMVKDAPLLGVGLSNWKTLLPHYGIFNMEFMDAGTLKFEHPHNDYLLVLAENGIIGLIFYLLIFFFILREARKNIRNSSSENERTKNVLVFSTIGGLMLLSFFEFPMSRFYQPLLLLIYFSIVRSKTFENNSAENKFSSSFQKIFLIVSIGMSSYSAWFFVNRYKSEVHFANALTEQFRKNWNEMEHEISLAKSPTFQSDRLGVPLDWYEGFALFYSGNHAEALPHFEAAVKLNPYHVQGWNDLATCYEQEKNFPEAIRCYKTALGINPKFYNSILNLTAAYFNSGDFENAYQTILTYPWQKRNKQYKTFLFAVMRQKLAVTINSQTDELLKEKMVKRSANDKYLLKIFQQSVSNHKDFVMVFVKQFHYSITEKKMNEGK